MKDTVNTYKNHQLGVTLVELLVVLSITGILAGVALPQISDLKASFNRLNARSYFVQDLKRSQAEAITQGCRGILVIAANGESYSFGCDYLSYDTTVPPVHDGASFVRNLPPNIRVASTEPLIFNSRGQAVDVNFIISNATVSFSEWNGSGYEQFATGTLLGTGAFSFN
jgi:prepilin-type N-terminal cleavage/methylation domain-containing protein